MPTFDTSRQGYQNLWNSCRVVDEHAARAKKFAQDIFADYPRYAKVSAQTGVPKGMIAVLHLRESDRNFRAHLHNGDSLNARTYHVPAGRPKTGSPPFGWEESAVDALTMSPHMLNRVVTTGGWTGPRVLYECEKYNGFGYVGKENSPYVWSWTNKQQRGKYVADGRFDSSAWDTQPGCAAILLELTTLDPEINSIMARQQTKAPDIVVKEQTNKERKRTGTAVGGTVVTGAEKTGTDVGMQQKTFAHSVAEWSLIGAGVVIGAVLIVLLVRRVNLIKQKWEG